MNRHSVALLLTAGLFTLVLLAVAPSTGRAENKGTNRDKCERQMFEIGDSMAEVLTTCGDPTSAEHWIEEQCVSERRGPYQHRVCRTIPRDRLTYNFGSNRFMRIFEFATGALIEQRTGKYGYSEE